MLDGREIFIAGGGVAGLTAALAFARHGARVTLAEQAEDAPTGAAERALGNSGGMGGRWQGGGLQVSPNGSRVLAALGLGAALRAASLEAAAVTLHDGFTGHRITRLAFPRGAEGTGYRLFRRSELVALLAGAARAAGVEILTAARVEWLGEGAAGVRLRLRRGGSQPHARQDGAAERGGTGERGTGQGETGQGGAGQGAPSQSVLPERQTDGFRAAGRRAGASRPGGPVGPGQPRPEGPAPWSDEREVPLALAADGIHSGARALLTGPGAPFFTGQVAWRALIEDGGAGGRAGGEAETRAFLGPGMHLVSYPLSHGGRNIVAVVERAAWSAEGWDHPDAPEHLRREFSSFAPEVRGWLARVEEVRLWGLFRHPVARRWHGARLALLGDAAHPTLPFMAQGANMALEDAWLLAEALQALPIELALPRWQALRAPRVTRAIEAANANARAYHLRGLTRYAAHRALWLGSMVAPGAALARFRWLYDYDVTGERL